MAASTPKYGVYTALVTFFNEDNSLDIPTTLSHVHRMAEGGVAGLVLQGSNGEAPHLDHSERKPLVRAIREYCNKLGYRDIQLIVECGALSVERTLADITDARESGADFALVLPPASWIAAINVPLLEGFFCDVAAKSPLPIIIYNYPGVICSSNIPSDAIIRVETNGPSVTGFKPTCHSVARLPQITATLWPYSFTGFVGDSDFFLDPLVPGSQGVISALANIVPKLHVQLLSLYRAGDVKEGQILQTKLGHANSELSKVGVAGVKAVIAHYFGHGSARERQPLLHPAIGSLDDQIPGVIKEVVRLEQSI